MRVCIVYDCLYPFTIGGAERWYRNLAERLASDGHEVTFLTRRQWSRGEEPAIDGVHVVAVSPRMHLYADGRRRLLPPVLFGLGVLLHLGRHGSRYDVVHTASFPYFSLLAAGAARRRGGFRIFVDWHELWTRAYWLAYAGRVAGSLGWRIQRACMRVPQRAFCFSRLHERRLRAEGFTGPLTRLEGQYSGPPPPDAPAPVPALAKAAEVIPDLRAELYGDGPERPDVLEAIDRGLADRVVAPGFVGAAELERALATALCFVLPSEREGYGLVIVESAAKGVPSVVVEGPDNAATELVEPKVNGVVASSATVEDLANAIVSVYRAGPELRNSTLAWFRRHALRLSLQNSIERVLMEYSGDAATGAGAASRQ